MEAKQENSLVELLTLGKCPFAQCLSFKPVSSLANCQSKPALPLPAADSPSDVDNKEAFRTLSLRGKCREQSTSSYSSLDKAPSGLTD